MARKKKEIKTISELKTYIEGAVEFNPEDWSPNKEQWDMIVDMIMDINEPEPQHVATQIVTEERQQSVDTQPVATQQGASLLDEADPESNSTPVFDEGPRAPAMDASINAAARPVVEDMGGSVADRDPSTGAYSSGIKVKTPNVDTSEKPYKSGFV